MGMKVLLRPALEPLRDHGLDFKMTDIPARDVAFYGFIPFMTIRHFGIFLSLRIAIQDAVL